MAINLGSMQKRISEAKVLTDKIFDQTFKDDQKTIVLKFSTIYYVFIAGKDSLTAFPLTTTKYRYFFDAEEIYNFLKMKDIQAVYEFEGEMNYLEIREAVKTNKSI